MGKLSVFVGAGVSKLSGYPSWSGLIKEMADEIGYKYNNDKKGNPIFSSEELLKVPQMYFICLGEIKYREKVQECFNNDCKHNEIHDLIMSLNPKHILTTNYDTLIEEAAVKFGRNFSVINSDKVVSETENTNYIVKVHGDFSSEFVLKEQDYLDYENKYELIDNIVKTIFATSLVVFIGYGLNDYNIKLILNWVKNVQSDSFVMPIFVHTGDVLSDIEKQYQKGRGLRILDCNDYTDDKEYVVKYSKVLEGILSYNATAKLDDKQNKLQYMYDKVAGIQNLSYVRRKDFDRIFTGEYELNDEWKIVNKTIVRELDKDFKDITSLKLNYFEDYYENKEEYQKINRHQCNIIDLFINKSGINGIQHDNQYFKFSNVEIKNLAFYCKYNEIYEFCETQYNELKDNYKKAYYLAQLGEYASSYELYTSILEVAKQNEQWDIYYFSQINRSYLFSIIKQMNAHTTGFHGAINFGQELRLFDDEFLKKINLEMNNHQLEEQFFELPYIFKSKYHFLDAYSVRNCYTDESVKLLKEKYESEKALTKDTAYFGLSKFDKLKLDMLETTKFIYDNMLLFSGFDENKLYVKNAMITWLESYVKEANKDESEIFGYISNSRCKFTLDDIILISKTFKMDDIDYLINKVDLKKVPFDESKNLEDYITASINFYSAKFNGTLKGGEIFLWKLYDEEIKNLLTISSYFLKNQDCIKNVVKFIIDLQDGRYIVYDRIKLLNKWIWSAKARGVEIYLEKWILEKLKGMQNGFIPEFKLEHHLNDVSIIADTLQSYSYESGYKCNLISEYILNNEALLKKIASSISCLYNTLNDAAKKCVDDIHEIEDVFQLIERSQIGELPDKIDREKIVKSYLENELEKKVQNGNNGIIRYGYPSSEDHIAQVATFMLIDKFSAEIVDNYSGNWDQYDFLLSPNKFNKNNFKIQWLFTYSLELLGYLKKNQIQKQIIEEVIESAISSKSLEIHQMKILFSVYQFMNQ